MDNNALRLRDLRRQFGPRFVETAMKSSTFVDALRDIRANKIKIRAVDGQCRAYYDRSKRTIYIGKWCPRNYKMISIIHEYVHALVKPTTDPIPGVTGRKEFIDRCLDEETLAIVTEIKGVIDLQNAGIHFEVDELCWLAVFLDKGIKGIRKKLNNTVTSTTGENYREYYGAWYDEVVPPAKRRP